MTACVMLKDLLVLVIVCRQAFGFVYSNDGISISFYVNFKQSCRGEQDRIGTMQNIPLPECAKECSLRPYCKALNFNRKFNTCHLYTSKMSADNLSRGNCVEVKASDIQIIEHPCSNCEQTKACVPIERQCVHKECLGTVNLSNGKVSGNLKAVGNSIQYTCNSGYTEVNAAKYAVCLPNGNWNVTAANCVEMPGSNVAVLKPTLMSSVLGDLSAKRAVDGNTDQNLHTGLSCFHSITELDPWWRVDLEALFKIFRVKLFNRLECCSDRTNDLRLSIGTSLQSMAVVGTVPGQIDNIHTFNFPAGIEGRYVQVSLVGLKILQLCEVQVFGFPMPGSNVAVLKPTLMSSVLGDLSAKRAVDGNTDQNLHTGLSCFHSIAELDPWWRVDLEALFKIFRVKLFNRLECCSDRTNDLRLSIGTSLQSMAVVGTVPGQIDNIHTFNFPAGIEGRYVQVSLVGLKILHLCEVQVFGFPKNS